MSHKNGALDLERPQLIWDVNKNSNDQEPNPIIVYRYILSQRRVMLLASNLFGKI